MIGENIAYYRAVNGWSLTALASSSGVSQSLLQKIENNNHPYPAVHTLEKLAQTLQIPLHTILATNSNSTLSHELEEAWLNVVESAMSKEQSNYITPHKSP
ncbi:XRE family transcriptional regulator, master regulator for biofilm formation [Alteribacillus persepolensis]|uniref:XRE family transcriptional regulator, master regulator for biofilm formation n=1 Tax=Alteribacillus persepolensis TaxID=568899 RepID=A0A1G8JJ10_9BACI|nr:helix-turn-helix domain-containing protein [Alteribacillus persepolensis]SDI31053.1 XRE family transcriptional regulator, master regulator for biofilm formation [Alteribacillus persepolensis]